MQYLEKKQEELKLLNTASDLLRNHESKGILYQTILKIKEKIAEIEQTEF